MEKLTKCEIGRPKVLQKNIIKKADTDALIHSKDWGQLQKEESFWIAYSDRSDNQTYKGPGESYGVNGKLGFNEKVRIAKIKDGFAYVYDEKVKGVDYPAISTSAVFKGWIPMNNLLLWGSCPADDAGIYNKALAVVNLDQMKKTVKLSDLMIIYDNPVDKKDPKEFPSSMDPYYIMKEDNGMILLATECKMEGLSDKVLRGWVRPGAIIPWSQRTCLEPTWDEVTASALKGDSVPVYKDATLSQVACWMPMGRKNNVGLRGFEYRMDPKEMRYPLLDNDIKNKDLYKVTAFATEGGLSHVPPVPKPDDDKKKIILDELKKQSIINLVVVIDGTKSMDDYYNPTQQVIQKAYDYFAENGNTVKVGIVIYRDYTDGEYVTEKLTMRNPKDPTVAEFLSTGGKYGIKSAPSDITYAEALYKGLEVALDASSMGYSKENSNLMIVIGDCGNDENDTKCISKEEIVKRCVDNHMQVISFQVRSSNDAAFENFDIQMGDIIMENVAAQYGKLKDDEGKISFKGRWKDVAGGGYKYVTNLPKDKNFYMGATHTTPMGQDMDRNLLFQLVTESYIQFNEAIDARKAILANSESIRYADAGSSGALLDLKYLETIMTPEQLKILKEANSLTAFQAYAKKQSPSNIKYWKPVVYISSAEFDELLEKLKPVDIAALDSDNKNRMPFVNAMKDLARIMVPDITEEDMNKMDTGEIMAMIAGLNEASETLKKHTLMEIADESKVDANDFSNIVENFKKAYKKLIRIKTNEYKFSVETKTGNLFYWLPVEDLP